MSFFDGFAGIANLITKAVGDIRTDVPATSSPNYDEKVREAVSTMLGNRGNPLDRALTIRDLQDGAIIGTLLSNSVDASAANTAQAVSAAVAELKPLISEAAVDMTPDLTPPPTPDGFSASASITLLLISCNAPSYTQGHGHAKSILYGTKWTDKDPLPVFSDTKVIKLTEFSGSTYSYPSDPKTTWRLWLKWVSVDNVVSLTPAGGLNGVLVTTGEDVQLLLDAISGKITKTELNNTLNNRIDLIDGPASLPNSLAANVNYLKSFASLSSKSFRADTAPKNRGTDSISGDAIPLAAGDLWIDTSLSNGVAQNKQYQWSGTAWVYSPDSVIADVSARINNVEQTKIGYCTKSGIATDHTDSVSCAAAGGTWNIGLPLSTAVKQVNIAVGSESLTLEQRFTAQKTTNGQLLGSYTVKIDNAGRVAGFGLASEPNLAGGSTTSFGVNADYFYVAPSVTYIADAAPAYANIGDIWYYSAGRRYYKYTAQGWTGFTLEIPFSVQTVDTVDAKGKTIPAGVYLNAGFIKNATITAAKIGSVNADSIQTGYLNAKVSHAGAIYNGVAAYTLVTDPNTSVITATETGYTPGTNEFGTGYYLGNLSTKAQFFVGSPSNYAYWNGSALTVKGAIYATSGSFSGEIKAATMSSGTINLMDDGAGGWGYIRSGNTKWWRDSPPQNGWILARESGTGQSFAHFQFGNAELRMSSWGDTLIQFGDKFYADAGGNATFGGTLSGKIVNAANINGQIITADYIVSNSATSFELATLWLDNAVSKSFDFYMDHDGQVCVIYGGGWAQSGSGGNYSYRISLNSDYAQAGMNGNWYSSGAPNPSVLMISQWCWKGWNKVYSNMQISTATGKHVSYLTILKSYR